MNAEDTQHTINTGYFHPGPVHEIPGHVPGVAFSDPQVNPELQKIHRGLLSETAQFDQGQMTSYRPVGSFSASSRHSEGPLQDGQGVPADRRDDYYR
ncbi:hypothetical protein [Streptomyces sp. NPDC096033]|uniref:hypothetical protein n=1 Tax=Streptomyces sp. NPDC096033 TaxID=3366071 RepID=UPI0038053D73